MPSTLQNFGVPLGTGGRAGILMPKLKNRFRVSLLNFLGGQEPVAFTQQVITVARPKVSFEPVEVHAYNSIAYYAGKAKWDTIAVTVRDDISNSVSALIGRQLMYQMNFFNQTVATSAGSFKFDMLVETLDGGNDNGAPDDIATFGGGAALETWYYEGCFLSDVNYQAFDYATSEAMTIEMTVRFDNATTEQMVPTKGFLSEFVT